MHAMLPLLFMNSGGPCLKVNVGDFEPSHFRAARPRVSRKAAHRIQERLNALFLDERQKLIHFRHRQEQAIPQILLLGGSDAPPVRSAARPVSRSGMAAFRSSSDS